MNTNTPTKYILNGRAAAGWARACKVPFERNETSSEWVKKSNGKWNGYPPKTTYDGIRIAIADLALFTGEYLKKVHANLSIQLLTGKGCSI